MAIKIGVMFICNGPCTVHECKHSDMNGIGFCFVIMHEMVHCSKDVFSLVMYVVTFTACVHSAN